MPPIDTLDALLRRVQPVLHPGRYAFVSLPDGRALAPAQVVASIREPEGLSVVVPEQVALTQGLPIAASVAWITLMVHSSLAAVGFTAVFARALAQAGISGNVVAGVHHDHVFVPIDHAQRALEALHALSNAPP